MPFRLVFYEHPRPPACLHHPRFSTFRTLATSFNCCRYSSSNSSSRNVAHFQGVPHGAVQVAVIIWKEVDGDVLPHICLHRRSRYKKTDPGKWDIMGGRLEADERVLPDKNMPGVPSNWEGQGLIARLFWETAVREANEEFRLKHAAFKFTEQHLYCTGGIGGFETGFDKPYVANREVSTFFLAFVPKEVLTLRERGDLTWHSMPFTSAATGTTNGRNSTRPERND